jgi:hypothetical protein
LTCATSAQFSGYCKTESESFDRAQDGRMKE